MLDIVKVSKYFGGLAALKDVEISLEEKKISALIGPNGAGKTTLFNVITGLYRPTSGRVKFNGEDITNLRPYQICKKGIGRTFQLVRPFQNLSVLENVMVAGRFGCEHLSSSDLKDECMQYIRFVGLEPKKDVFARNLTLYERKRLEIARALASRPKLILLDEVMAGLNPTETAEAMNLVKSIRDKLGITVFWIEHVMRAVMGLAEHIIVLHHGEKIAEGKPEKIANDPEVISAYLGEKYLF